MPRDTSAETFRAPCTRCGRVRMLRLAHVESNGTEHWYCRACRTDDPPLTDREVP